MYYHLCKNKHNDHVPLGFVQSWEAESDKGIIRKYGTIRKQQNKNRDSFQELFICNLLYIINEYNVESEKFQMRPLF